MFNDPIAAARFQDVVARHGTRTVVETGTHLGAGAMNCSRHAPDVITAEVSPDFRRAALANVLHNGWHLKAATPTHAVLERDGHAIHSHLGSSPEVIRTALRDSTFRGPFLFYLDAHWHDYWPLLDELTAIAELGLHDATIIIHDFQVPGRPWGFDTYKGQPLNLEYVRGHLDRINPDYVLSYNADACPGPSGRGILYAAPPAPRGA